ncbi:hypothetical protein SAMN05443247_07617 [Bradyrhizobium erythrophlei]|nr:hypothetical protein SAMN05443247_07617 [Bradyrhizobium erythrophlei]
MTAYYEPRDLAYIELQRQAREDEQRTQRNIVEKSSRARKASALNKKAVPIFRTSKGAH